VRGRPSRGSIAVAVLGLAGTMTLQYVAFALAPLVAANAIAYSWPLMVAAGVGVTHGSRRPIAPGGALNQRGRDRHHGADRGAEQYEVGWATGHTTDGQRVTGHRDR